MKVPLLNLLVRSLPQKTDVIDDMSQFVLISIWGQLSIRLAIIHRIHEECTADSGGWLTHPLPNSLYLFGPMICQQVCCRFTRKLLLFWYRCCPFLCLLLKGTEKGWEELDIYWLWGKGQENQGDFCAGLVYLLKQIPVILPERNNC